MNEEGNEWLMLLDHFVTFKERKFSNDNEQGDIKRREENYISRGGKFHW